MRWQGEQESENVEDQRGARGSRRPAMVGGGIGTLLIVIVVALLGGDPRQALNFLNQVQNLAPQQQQQIGEEQPPVLTPEEQELTKFVKVVLRDTEVVWDDLFRQMQREYVQPKLVLFSNSVQSACGMANSAVGPFYCPGDQKVYIDLAFYDDLRRKFKAPGDFAQAYVIAHEIGHHVQNQLGISDKVHAIRGRASEAEYNRASVRLELQADYFAGVWAHHAQKLRKILEEGDIEEALTAALAIGDDRLQKQSQGYVVPEKFTHGTSKQRVRWFTRGFKSGEVRQAEQAFQIPYEQL